MITLIKLNAGIEMEVECPRELTVGEVEEIKGLNLDIFWSDGRSKHWSMDEKLQSSGKWLENIYYTNELDKCTALICS